MGHLRLDALVLAAGLALFAILLIAFPPRLNHDVAQYLSAGWLVVEGARPFVEVVDTNPPMILYLSAVPAAVASWTGWSLARCGVVFLATLFGAAFAALAWALPGSVEREDRAAALVGIGGAWLWLSVGTYLAPSMPQFGQRDALIGAFVIPFVVLRHARYDGGAPSERLGGTLVGALALVAAGMKPQFLVVLAVVEAMLALHARRLRAVLAPETLAFVGAGALYAAHFLVVPGMSAFYTRWLGVIRHGYGAYDATWARVLETLTEAPVFGFHIGGAACASLVLAVVGWRSRSALLRCAGTLGVLGVLTAVAYVVQFKAWAYQALPLQFATVTSLGFVAAYGVRAVRVQTGPVVAQAASAVLVLGLLAQAAGPVPPPPSRVLTETIRQQSGPDDRVLVVSPRVRSAFPALTYAERRPAGPFLTTFPLAFVYHDAAGYAPPPEWASEETALYASLVATVRDDRPRLILVNARPGPHGTPDGFRVDAYLRRRGFFRGPAAAYVPVDTIDVPDVGPHVVYRRP